MKIFTNKNLIQKLIVAIVAVTLLEFCIAPLQVKAATVGGTLAKPIRDLAVTLGDAFISLAQYGITGTWIDAVDRLTWADKDSKAESSKFWISKVRYPLIQLSPELIFANEVEILDANFVTVGEKESYILGAKNGKVTGDEKGALEQLRIIIASWYVTLRTLAIVGLLSVLIYIGIRIIISSTSQDKAKYKQRIMDWIVAFCILFFMHYIMVGIVTIVGEVNNTLSKTLHIGAAIPLNEDYGYITYNKDNDTWEVDEHKDVDVQNWLSSHGYTNIKSDPNYATNETIIEFEKDGKKYRVTIHQDPTSMKYDSLSESGIGYSKMPDFQEMKDAVMNGKSSVQTQPEAGNTGIAGGSGEENKDEGKTIEGAVETTNKKDQKVLVSSTAEGNGSTILYFINYARLYCNASEDYNAEGFAFTAIYIILVVFTVMFTFRYAKRVIYIAFLTLIAPLVAFTYPLDKIKDGKAQAFNLWFREYVFNILIQPFHLLIYAILIGSATSLAHQHMIYAVVTIAFLIPAEKLLRKFFGFDNAGTLSAAGSFAGGALFSTMVSKLNRPKPKGGSNTEGRDSQKPIRKANSGGGGVEAEDFLKDEGYQGQNARKRQQTTNVHRMTRTNVNTSNDQTASGEQETNRTIGRTNDEIENDFESMWGDNTSTGSSWYSPNNMGNVIIDIDNEAESGQSIDSENNDDISHAWSMENKVSFWDRLSGANGKYTADDIHLSEGRMSGKSEEEIQKIKEKEARKRNRLENVDNLTDAVADHYKDMAIKGVKSLPGAARKLVRRGVIGGVAGGALALTGAAVGAASGDAGAALKYATAGAGAGYYGANYYGDQLAKDNDKMINQAETAFWGEQAKARQQYVYDQEFKKNSANIEALTKVLGSRADAKEAMRDGTVQALLNNNITDINKIAKAVAKRNSYINNGMSKWKATERAVQVAKWNRDSGKSIYETNSAAHNIFIRKTKEQIKNNNPGISDARVDEMVTELFNDMAYFET